VNVNEDEKQKQKKIEEKQNKHKNLVQLVKDEVQLAEKRELNGEEICPMEGDIFYRWSSLGRAAYILPKWEIFSNMSPFPVVVDEISYPTLEHFYHVMKWIFGRQQPLLKLPQNGNKNGNHDDSKNPKQNSPEEHHSNLSIVELAKEDKVIASILNEKDPTKVKKLMGKNGKFGKTLPFHQETWDKVRPGLMERALILKVEQHPGIRRLLLESDKCSISERKLSHRKSTPPAEVDVAEMVVQWKGQWFGSNSAGKTWMKIREIFKIRQEQKKHQKVMNPNDTVLSL